MTETTLDFEAYYSVDGYRGIAFYLTGYAQLEDEWGETEDDLEHVYAVMVGDDYKHLVGVDELTKLDREAFCGECGQVGCTHDGLER